MRAEDGVRRVRAALSRTDFAGRCFSLALLFSIVFLLEKQLPSIAFLDQGWAIWWPTNGITLALLLISRRVHWPFILCTIALATSFAQPLVQHSPSFLITSTIADMVEVIIPALMLPRFYTLSGWLQKPSLVWRFILSATLLGPACSTLLMACFFHWHLQQNFWFIAQRWGSAHVVGIVMYTPMVLVLISPELYALFRRPQLPSTVSALSLLLVASWFVFLHDPHPISFVIGPVLLLIATRHGFSGSVLAINLLAPIATYATVHDMGPFAMTSALVQEPHKVIIVQFFLVLSLLMVFPISVARVQQQSTSSQLQHAYHQMEMLATADGLTGLANRRRFDTALDAEWRRGVREGQPVAMLMLDADNFKKYNDHYGHPAGDVCLQSIAKAICDIPQRAGDLVARYGGEEFVILLPGVDAEGAHRVAELVRYNVRMLNLPHVANPTGSVTISVGCASMMPRENLDPGALMEGSDRALYMAKQRGRNQACVYQCEEVGPSGNLHLATAEMVLKA